MTLCLDHLFGVKGRPPLKTIYRYNRVSTTLKSKMSNDCFIKDNRLKFKQVQLMNCPMDEAVINTFEELLKEMGQSLNNPQSRMTLSLTVLKNITRPIFRSPCWQV